MIEDTNYAILLLWNDEFVITKGTINLMNEIKSQRQIIQVGNSLATTIPANIARKLKVQKGDAIDVSFRNDIQLDDQFFQSLETVIDQFNGALNQLRGEQ